MRILPLTTIVLLVGAGYALAQGTPNSPDTMSSGRPSAVLTDAQCQEVWKKAVPSGDTLAQADAAPYIVNFTQVDTDGDGVISIAEFQAACGKGLVKYTMKSIAAASLREFCAAPPLPVSAYPCCRRLPTRSRSRPLRRVSPSHSISSRTHASPFMSGRAVAATGAATGAEGGAFAAGTGGSVRSLAGDQARAMPKWAEAKTCAFRASLEYSATSKQFDSDCSFGRTVKWR